MFYNMQNSKLWRPKKVTYLHRSLATNPMNIGILLQSTTSQPLVSIQSVATQPHDDLLLADLSNCCRSLQVRLFLVNHVKV